MKYVLAALVGGWLTVASPALALTKCSLTFTLEGWSFFYKAANGTGVVQCDNGQEARVALETRGGGITFGSNKIVDGSGDFSLITDIDEIFGNYANAEAHAGMGVSSGAQVVTKGPVSLAISGTGNGVDVGFAFGRFTITRSAVRREPQESPRAAATPDDHIGDEDLPPSDEAPPVESY